MTVTDREPAPTPHTAGSARRRRAVEESTRAGAHARARLPQIPPAPQLLHTLFVGDGPSPMRETLPRLRARVDYALHGDWCGPESNRLRWGYLLLYTLPIACPIAAAIDFLDWATHPAGRLLVTAAVIWLIAANL